MSIKKELVETRTDINKKNLILALEDSLGIVTTACRKLGIHRSTYYEYYKNDPEFKLAVIGLQDVALDFAESQLHKQIMEGSPAATIFYLKTRGRKRGYVERTEVTGVDGSNLVINVIPDGFEKV